CPRDGGQTSPVHIFPKIRSTTRNPRTCGLGNEKLGGQGVTPTGRGVRHVRAEQCARASVFLQARGTPTGAPSVQSLGGPRQLIWVGKRDPGRGMWIPPAGFLLSGPHQRGRAGGIVVDDGRRVN